MDEWDGMGWMDGMGWDGMDGWMDVLIDDVWMNMDGYGWING